MTNEDKEIYNNSHICWMCKQELNMDKDKVRDHCHKHKSETSKKTSNCFS